MASSQEIQAKLDKLEINMERFDDIINSNDTSEITVDTGTVPSISKFYSDITDGSYFATSEQGAKADTAVQPGALGNAAVKNFYYGTSAPASGFGADGDIYFRYE